MKTFSLARVTYVPKELETGVLYVSQEYAVAAHLCACGCGQKVATPLTPTEWTFSERSGLPTLRPSIGSWQLPCQSHYFITDGQVRWERQWTAAQISTGRWNEEVRRQAYYAKLKPRRGFWQRLWTWLTGTKD